MLEIILPIVVVAIVASIVVIFYLKRKQKQKDFNKQFNYTTVHGIRVKLSERLKDLSHNDIEYWTEDLVDFWFKTKGWDKDKIYKAISYITLFMYDQEYLERVGQKVNGVTWPSSSVIELATLHKAGLDQSIFTPYHKVKSLFRHEVSHIIVERAGGIICGNGEEHHRLFKEVKLGA